MSHQYQYLGSISQAAVANMTLNLANFIVSVTSNPTAANSSGPIPARPQDSNERNLLIIIDNKAGTADAWLASPDDIDAGQRTAMVARAGQMATYGPFKFSTWGLVLRLLDNASVHVTVLMAGAPLPS